MPSSRKALSDFPPQIKNPESYYDGVDQINRVVCRNVIVFERVTRKALQQQHVTDRMHHRYVLIRVLRTAGVVSVDGQGVRLDVGDALLLTPYQFHHFIDLEAADVRWLIITFELDQGQTTLAELSYHRLQPDARTHELWKEIVNLWLDTDSANRKEIIPVLDRILMRLHSKATDLSLSKHEIQLGSDHEWIARIEALIMRSVREGWTLAEVAQQAGCSVRHLRNRFEQQMGLTLSDYRSNYQFHVALSLMRNSSSHLSSIAESSGFNSQSVFTRFIRRMAGRTPRELCQQIRAGRYDLD